MGVPHVNETLGKSKTTKKGGRSSLTEDEGEEKQRFWFTLNVIMELML